MDNVKMEDHSSVPGETETSFYGEDTSTERSYSRNNLPRASDYWYGRRYFEDIIAQDIFRCSSADDAVHTIDSRFRQHVHDFPYQEAIRYLQAEESPLFRKEQLEFVDDNYATLATFAGIVIRLGGQREQEIFVKAVRNFTGLRNGTQPDPRPQQSRLFQSVPPVAMLGRSSPPTRATEALNASYTSMLAERAQIRNISLDYKIQRSPNDPDLFRAGLSFRGHTFWGDGRSKQLAKHEASKAACEFLEAQREPLF